MAQKINVPMNFIIKQLLKTPSPFGGRLIAAAAAQHWRLYPQNCRQFATTFGGKNWPKPMLNLRLRPLPFKNYNNVQFESPFTTTTDGPNDKNADEQQHEENLDNCLIVKVENYEQIYQLSCGRTKKGLTLLANETIQNEEFKRASNIVADKFLNEVVESMFLINIYASLQIDEHGQKTLNFLKFIGPSKLEEFMLISIGYKDWVSPPINFAEHAQSLVIILDKAWAFLNTWKADDKNLDTVIYTEFVPERKGSKYFGLMFKLQKFGGFLEAEIFLINENNEKIEPSFLFGPEYIPKMRETIAGWLHGNQ